MLHYYYGWYHAVGGGAFTRVSGVWLHACAGGYEHMWSSGAQPRALATRGKTPGVGPGHPWDHPHDPTGCARPPWDLRGDAPGGGCPFCIS